MTYNWDAISDNRISTAYTKYKAIFESPYEMFMFCSGRNEHYGVSDYMLGAVVDGVCKEIDDCPDIVVAYYLRTTIERATGNATQTEYGYNEATVDNFGYFFSMYSEDDYSFNGYSFESMNAAQAFYDNGDTSGVDKFPLQKMFDGMPEEVKTLYLRDSIRKNIRIHFPNGERADIANQNIDGESFAFTESICSRRQLKFGLCEASVVKFTCVDIENIKGYEIEVFHEIDISSLPYELRRKYGSGSKDVPYIYFRWSYGKFVVDECPRQSDMRRRKVVAYSNNINFDINISPFEKAKWSTKFRNNTNFSFNPANFAISSISQSVNFDLSCVGAFSIPATSIKNRLTDGVFYVSLYNSYNPSLGQDIGATLVVNYKDLSLMQNASFEGIFAYKMGEPSVSDYMVQKKFLSMIEPYKDRITSYDDKISDNLQKIVNHCHPVVYMQDYINKGGYYSMKYGYGMRDNGLFAPKFDGYAGNQYGVRFPYSVMIEIRQLKGGSSTATTIETFTFDLFDKNSIDVDGTLNNGDIYLPSSTKTVTRAKNSTGEYVLDTNDYPDTSKSFEALFELNASFLMQNKDGVYSNFRLSGNYGLFPSLETFPSPELFPSSAAYFINTSQYLSVWYDDKRIEPYTEIFANYTNSEGEKASILYHETEYEKEYVELITQTFVNDGTGKIEVDLSTNNPFTNGMTVYGTADGLTITEAWTNNGGDFLFDIYDTGKARFEWIEYSWEDATKLTICVDASGLAIGTEIDVCLGFVTQSEIQGIEYNTLDLSNNYLIANSNFYQSQLESMFKKTLELISGVSYLPTDIELIGMPWIAAGDRICVNTNDGTINTYVLRRTLKGIQSLKDNYESR